MAFTQPDRDMLTAVFKAVFGDQENRKDLGLVGDVKENTKFRHTTARANWILLIALLTMCGTIIAGYFN